MKFTVFDPAERRILWSGEGPIAPTRPHLLGVAADPQTFRLLADLSGVEPKPEVAVTLGALPVAPGAPLAVTLDADCRLTADDADAGPLPAGDSTIAFPDPGIYRVVFEPIAGHLYLPAERTIEVAGAPAPAPADLTAPESAEAMRARLAALLDRIEVLAQHAETGVTVVDAIRARPMANAAELRDAVKDLAQAVSRSFEESAEQMRALRRCVMVVRDFLRRSAGGGV